MLLGTRRVISVLCVSVVMLVAGSLLTEGVALAQSRATGGFVDSSTGRGLRPMLSAGEIQAFMPQRGTFTFPSPYSTTGIRPNECQRLWRPGLRALSRLFVLEATSITTSAATRCSYSLAWSAARAAVVRRYSATTREPARRKISAHVLRRQRVQLEHR